MLMLADFPILLVDDEDHIAEVIKRAAHETFPNARIHVVRDYAQAVDYLRETIGPAPQLILLDIDLHVGPSGLDFLERIRQHPQWRLIPTVVLTHLEDEAANKDSYELGANYFSIKPYSFDGWKDYMLGLSNYWFRLVARPIVWLGESKLRGFGRDM
jgi:CheY-like chemotaxis protein